MDGRLNALDTTRRLVGVVGKKWSTNPADIARHGPLCHRDDEVVVSIGGHDCVHFTCSNGRRSISILHRHGPQIASYPCPIIAFALL